MSPTPTKTRVAALRQRRAELGLTRLEVYAHPDDHPPIKALAERLARKRLKSSNPPGTGRKRDL